MPVEALLDQLHAAILTANFGSLGTLCEALENELTCLPAGTGADHLLRMQQKAKRNAALAQASCRGIRATIRRLAEMKKISSGLSTYDEKGQRAEHRNTPDVSRRL